MIFVRKSDGGSRLEDYEFSENWSGSRKKNVSFT